MSDPKNHRHRKRKLHGRRAAAAVDRFERLRRLIWRIWHRRPLGQSGIAISEYTLLTKLVEGGELPPEEK